MSAYDLYAVNFFDELTGMVVGAEGTLLTTTDGGINWIEQTSGTTYNLNDVCFTNDSTAITVGGEDFDGIILRTTDIGVTWIEQTSPPAMLQYWKILCFTDSLTGFAVGLYSNLIGTTDGGINWFEIQDLYGFGYRVVTDICFVDSNIGYVVGGKYHPSFPYDVIIKTTDGGITWNKQESYEVNTLYAICFTDSLNGNVVGDYGLILRTTDGGNTWNNQSSVTRNNLYEVCFADKYYGMALGVEPWEFGAHILIRTTDGGNNWLLATEVSSHNAVSLADSNNGIAVGFDIISKTTDGGITWEHQDFPGKRFYGVSYIDANHATTVGNGGIIFHTTDGGENWIEQKSNTTQDLIVVCCTDSNHGVAVGYSGTVLLTNDGGNAWSQPPSGTSEELRSVSFGDSLHGWIVFNETGCVLKTSDGGFSWIQKTIGTTELYDVSFSDPDNGTVVGAEGTILRTTDGGNTWIQQTSGTTDGLWRVWFTDPDNGTAVGGTGLILRTTNGGVSFIEENQINAFPTNYTLTQNYPNPFNPNTKIKYSIPQSSNVVIKVYDILGNEIETLVNEERPTGTYEITWYAENLPSGVYFYRLQAGDYVETKKMVLLR
jgi:photosystem II stability/assembly factor-like uncharacterized protein